MGCSFGFIWISFKLREKMKKYANEAYEIVQYMRKYTDKITEKEHLNFAFSFRSGRSYRKICTV